MRTDLHVNPIGEIVTSRLHNGRRGGYVPVPITPLVAVTGSQPPYIYDLPWLLSLPDGFEFRFRYHEGWVSNDVLGEMRSRPDHPLRRPLIVVFHSQERKRLLPVRRCRVLAIEKMGPVVFLRFAVGPFVDVSPTVLLAKLDSHERKTESDRLSNLGRQLLGLHDFDLGNRLPSRQYLSLASTETQPKYVTIDGSDAQAVATSWAALAALLMNEDHLFQIPMFHLLGFQELSGGFKHPKELGRLYTLGGITGGTPARKGFRLVAGKRYRLRVLEWCETIKGSVRPAKLVVNAPPELLSLEGSSNLVVGGYDVLEFLFKAVRPGYTEISAGVASQDEHPAQKAESESRAWPMVYIAQVPVEVRHNWVRVGTLVGLGAIGAFLYTSLPGKIWELTGLLILFTTLGGLLEGFVRFSSEIRDFPPVRARSKG